LKGKFSKLQFIDQKTQHQALDVEIGSVGSGSNDGIDNGSGEEL
jgi:hypothetical protein